MELHEIYHKIFIAVQNHKCHANSRNTMLIVYLPERCTSLWIYIVIFGVRCGNLNKNSFYLLTG